MSVYSIPASASVPDLVEICVALPDGVFPRLGDQVEIPEGVSVEGPVYGKVVGVSSNGLAIVRIRR